MSEAPEKDARDGVEGASVTAAAILVSTFGLMFALLAILPVKVPAYIPLEHRWQWGMPDPPLIGMDYYGRTIVALVVAIVASGIAWLIAGPVARWKPAENSQAVKMLAIYAFTGTALSVFIYCYTLVFK